MEASTSTYFFIAYLALFTFLSEKNKVSAIRTTSKTNTEFIKTSCSTTMYPKLCFNSLSTHANAIQTSPKLLAQTSLSLSFNTTKSTSSLMLRLSKIHNISPREAAAMRDCVEVLGDSVDELRDSVREMSRLSGSQFEFMISNIQTWVSAALTDDDTCMDGFATNAVNENIKNVVRKRILSIAHLTSNALALVNNFASRHG